MERLKQQQNNSSNQQNNNTANKDNNNTSSKQQQEVAVSNSKTETKPVVKENGKFSSNSEANLVFVSFEN